MARHWEPNWVRKYADMQQEILKSAAAMLAPGGRIVYSTCTFAPEENEATIAGFLLEHPEFRAVPLGLDQGIAPGRPEWLTWLAERGEGKVYPPEIAAQTAGCGRLWPHKVEGEGHFLAVLERHGDVHVEKESEDVLKVSSAVPWQGSSRDKRNSRPSHRSRPGAGRDSKGVDDREVLESWRSFAREQLDGAELPGEPLLFGGNVYLSPLAKDRLDRLKVVRPGWYVGTVKNGRLTPGQPLATALSPTEAVRVLDLSSADGEAIRYLKGETLQVDKERIRCRDGVSPKGYVLVTVDGYSLGWGQMAGRLVEE